MLLLTKLKPDAGLWQDGRGWGLDPLAVTGLTGEQIGDLHLVSLQPGAVRGNHLHLVAREWMIILGGRVSLAWRQPGETGVTLESCDLTAPAALEIPPGVAHTVRNDGGDTIFLLSLSDCRDRQTKPVADLFAQ